MHATAPSTLIKSEAEFQRLINGGDVDRVASRASNLLHNKSFTDVTFIVGPPHNSKKYVGHRVLLAMTSPVFESMFYGEMADKSKVIRIPDLAPIGFENLLRYAYTDSLNLNSVKDAMLTAYAAKKYLLPHLLRECLAYIDKNIGPNCACAVFEFASVLNSHQLMFQALQLIDKQTYHVITHKSFASIQAATLEMLVSRRYLNLYSEYSLCCAVLQWSVSEAKRRQFNPADWLLIRGILQECNILKYVRFLTMSNEEFSRVIAQTSGHSLVTSDLTSEGQLLSDVILSENTLLTRLEQVAIFMNLAIPAITPIPKGISTDTNPRTAPPEFFIARRYKPIAYSTGGAIALNSTSKTLRTITSKFQLLNRDLFIIGASIPIRLDASYYSLRTPKLDCQVRFLSRGSLESLDGRAEDSTILDSVEDAVSLVISKEKDCIVRLKKPIHVKKGNLNELAVTFQPTTLVDDLQLIKGHHVKPMPSDLVDPEGVSWIFFKTSHVEFNELYYYY